MRAASLLVASLALIACGNKNGGMMMGPDPRLFAAENKVIRFTTQPSRTASGAIVTPVVAIAGATNESNGLRRVALTLLDASGQVLLDGVSGELTMAAADGTASFATLAIGATVPQGSYRLRAATLDNPEISNQWGESEAFEITRDGKLYSGNVSCRAGATTNIAGFASIITRDPSAMETISVDGPCTTVVFTGPDSSYMDVDLGTASCTGPGGTISCTSMNGLCSTNGPSPFASAGQQVTVAWGGGVVPAGSAMLSLGAPITTTSLPTTASRSAPLVVSFTGGSTGAGVLVTVAQNDGTTYISTQCRGDAGSGSISIPAAALARYQPGMVSVSLNNESFQTVNAGPYQMGAGVIGPVSGPLALGQSITLQ